MLYVIVWFDDRMGLQILMLDIEINALQKLSFAQYACYVYGNLLNVTFYKHQQSFYFLYSKNLRVKYTRASYLAT